MTKLKYDQLASKDIRDFIWYYLKLGGFFDENDYIADGFDIPLVPIIPSQQVPEFNNLLPGKPYIYYEFEVLPSKENWWITEEMMTLYIVSSDYDFINRVNNFLLDLMRKYDRTARRINEYFKEANSFKFYYVRIESIQSPLPFESEGGLLGGVLELNYSYSRITDRDWNFFF
ncbi:MAG: hypothetical protein EB127_01870 [Alphaproteobacteria bacterium]|nr:hypothetical protein [Alphaproteobacteria bacterium]